MERFSKLELIDLISQSTQEKENLEFLLENLNGISWEYDLKQDFFSYISKNAKSFLGYELEEWTDFASWAAMLHEDDREKITAYCSSETQRGKKHFMEYRMVKKSGEVIWVLDTVTLAKDENGVAIKLFGFFIDVTEKKEAEQKLAKEHKFLQNVLNRISDPIMIINSDYTVNIMNETVKKQLEGKTFMDPSQPKCYEISHHRDTPCDGIDDPCPLKNVLETRKETKVLHNHKHEDGTDHFVELAASPLFDEDDNCIGIIESARNITKHITLSMELEAKTRELEYQATHDYLTGLPNRALFMDRLDQSIKDADRNQTSLALFFMDLDHFKEINDTLGHETGDSVLKAVCKKFQACTRANDVLSRLAGDEFTVILKDIKNNDDVAMIAQKFIDIFDVPLLVDQHQLRLSVSIGISIYSQDAKSSGKLLQRADTAMYEAKAKGKSNFQFVNPSTF